MFIRQLMEENVSQAMEVARAVRESISLVEHITGHTIDVMSLSYNRMMNHIRYMVARAVSGEKLKVNMNDYMSVKFPKAFRRRKRICEEMEKRLKLPMEEIENWISRYAHRTDYGQRRRRIKA